MIKVFHIVMQELLPSSTPYSVLDYGVTAIVLIVMGIVLYFTFKTLAKILADHATAMHEISQTLRVMKENQLTLITDTRYLHDSILESHKEHVAHRVEQTAHVNRIDAVRHDAENDERKAQRDYRNRNKWD